MKIKLVCDSLCDVPKELVEKYEIDIVPLNIILKDEEYKEGIDITNEEFYKRMKEKTEVPKTSQATYIQFKEVFDRVVAKGNEKLYISGSSRATGTYQSAVMAKNDTEGVIHTFDSENFSYGCGMQVVKAAQMAKEGASIDEIIKELEYIRDNIYVVFSVDELTYLQRGGRMSSSKAAIGNMLKIKPILEVKDGLVTSVAQVRGKKNIFSKIIELVKENCGEELSGKCIAIGHGDSEEDMNKLKELANETLNPKEILVTDVGSCIGAHAGPGVMGIFCIK
jgi:DegV family protein with EDD domain